jgi:hypothetical protein
MICGALSFSRSNRIQSLYLGKEDNDAARSESNHHSMRGIAFLFSNGGKRII